MEKDMKMPDEIWVSTYEAVTNCSPEDYWPNGWPAVFKQRRDRSTKYVRADLAPQQVDLEALKDGLQDIRDLRDNAGNSGVKYKLSKAATALEIAIEALLSNPPQAAPDNAGAKDTLEDWQVFFGKFGDRELMDQAGYKLPTIENFYKMFDARSKAALAKQGDSKREKETKDQLFRYVLYKTLVSDFNDWRSKGEPNE